MNKIKLVAKKSKLYRLGLMVLMGLLIAGCNSGFSASPTPIPLPAAGSSDSSNTDSSSTDSSSTEPVDESAANTASGEADSGTIESSQAESSQASESGAASSDTEGDASESVSSTDSNAEDNSDQGTDESPAMAPTATTEAGAAETSSVPAQGIALGKAVEPTRLDIERIGMAVPITPMEWRIVKIGDQRTTEWVIPESSAGWHPDSAGAGAAGNVIISGYQNVGESVFSQLALGNVQVGQEILVTDADGTVHKYLVSEVGTPIPLDGTSAAERERVAEYYAESDDARLTLVTGWPAFTTTHRMFIVATLVQN